MYNPYCKAILLFAFDDAYIISQNVTFIRQMPTILLVELVYCLCALFTNVLFALRCICLIFA